ncbi:MAG: SsrA-binding protein SmpB [Azospirillaceae bacterium]
MSAKKSGDSGTVAQNRRARYDYFIEDQLECGIVLAGTEVKSLREGKASLQDSYAGEDDGELTLFNAYIPEYRKASQFNHETRRPRRLLVHKRERDRLLGLTRQKGVTLVPMAIYFTKRGIAKVRLGVATGKRQVDKRETEKQRDWNREKQRLLREKG